MREYSELCWVQLFTCDALLMNGNIILMEDNEFDYLFVVWKNSY